MKEQREKDLRMNLAELDQSQLIKTCIDMQDVIDTLGDEKRGFTSSISQLNKQNQLLVAENERLESEVGGDPGASSAELEAANKEIGRLKGRVETLTELNEKLQEKLLG